MNKCESCQGSLTSGSLTLPWEAETIRAPISPAAIADMTTPSTGMARTTSMGNLGRYQDIVTEAKQLDGVDNLINAIEAGAVAKASPKIFAKGAGTCALGMLIVTGLAVGGKRVVDRKRARERAACEAKQQFKAEVGLLNPESPDVADGEGEKPTDGDEHRR